MDTDSPGLQTQAFAMNIVTSANDNFRIAENRSNKPRQTICLSIAIFLTGFFSTAAQEARVDWFSIDGGGGSSSGGIYSVSATIGQLDVGAMSGGEYSMQGGFWSILALEPDVVPLLRIARGDPTHVLILWPAPSAGWTLEESPTLGPSANWTPVGAPVNVNGTENTVTQPVTPGGRFYRLRHP
jgi:hypothetical protein